MPAKAMTKNPDNLRIVFWGTSDFAVPILNRLAVSPFRPALAVTTPDAPAGRGRKFTPPPLKEAALKLGVPVIQPDKLTPNPYPLSARFDLFIVAAYGKILPAELLAIPRFGSLNVHPSLLPHWRGPSPVQFAILNGDIETGVTIMLMDEKMDHGPVIRCQKSDIRNQKLTTPQLTKRLAELGAELLLEKIPEWLGGKITPQPQDESQATYSKLLHKEDGHVDWSKSAAEIERMVRAFKPWPGAYAFWNRGQSRLRLAMEEADVTDNGPDCKIGEVFDCGGNLGIKTSQGALMALKVKLEGKATAAGRDFLAGYRAIIGAILE